MNVYIHVHKAGKLLCCFIINRHQCSAITLSTVQHPDVEVEPPDHLTFGLLLEDLACFFLKYIL